MHSWASQPCAIFTPMDVRVGTDVRGRWFEMERRKEFLEGDETQGAQHTLNPLMIVCSHK